MIKRTVFVLVCNLVFYGCQFFIPEAIDGDKNIAQIEISDSIFLEPKNRLLLRRIDKNANTVLLDEIDSLDLRGLDKFFLSNERIYMLKNSDLKVHEVLDIKDLDIKLENVLKIPHRRRKYPSDQ